MFNQDNHIHVRNLHLEICNGVFGEPNRGTPKNALIQAPGVGTGTGIENMQPGSWAQLSSRDPFLPWRPLERARHNSGRSLSLNHGGFATGGGDKPVCAEERSEGNEDLVVYELGGDVKVVGLQGLGTYPIDQDFSSSFSSLASTFNQSQTFTAPISPISSSPSLLEFGCPSSSSTPPPSHRGSMSSPSSCSDPSPSWFSPLNSEHLKSHQFNNSAVCPIPSRHRSSMLPPSISETDRFNQGQSLAVPSQDIASNSMSSPSLSSASSSSKNNSSSYRYQETMTTTLCRQNVADIARSNQQVQSHTISSSWTFSSSSSLSPSPFMKQQESHFFSPGPSTSPSPSVWHDNSTPTDPDDTLSSLMPARLGKDQMDKSMYPAASDEDVIAMEYDALDASDVKKKAPRRNRNNSAKTGNHLWEFVRDLLQDPKFNPKLLKWEDKENGVFRFVQSEQVARLWGKKKNNPMMTYEKLSRAMRFCRKTGFFNAVPRTGKFPKKLCFMFGEKAHGWKD
ncbi:hypothetical protein EGW08_012539 [Elysia chlorotica]|uniref:ETS domain-containing protein n=1 Tax=Elysia chlorotica TaxID=188477 RepID=A0A3S1HHW8_ELYCH|nr:hypothetical protein EGW08_012539 [Elysia chlorotica]